MCVCVCVSQNTLLSVDSEQEQVSEDAVKGFDSLDDQEVLNMI